MAKPEQIAARRAGTGRDELRQHLELDLVLGRLKPRERLVEDEIMERFDAKRHVVRGALSDLEHAGLVERRPNRGAMVREYSLDEVEELYTFRADLHRLAIVRMRLPLAEKVVADLEVLAGRHEAAIRDGDLATVILCNNAFHDLLFDQCDNRFVADSIRQLGSASHAIRSYRVNDPQLLEQAAAEHREMIALARAGEREALASLCVRHILPSKDLYLRDHAPEGSTSGGST
ncbi:GntR family transcriptional regulator [Aliiruegeria haliotis]|uniref:GntR family transcriptional regulator n=1 Tax=Aliiruegeria haliotis TaxID=1280846 RepID=A0A2T0RLP8_9RHOB|nr:GntR family transcriptional regulator [Aliiruegeria haliotis]PRY22119.1 GntR family transcriptional regulator [Aliiruegeria haliotis]